MHQSLLNHLLSKSTILLLLEDILKFQANFWNESLHSTGHLTNIMMQQEQIATVCSLNLITV